MSAIPWHDSEAQTVLIPAALKIARLTAVLATWTLYPFWLSGLASRNAASAAAAAVSSLIVLPTSAVSAAWLRHGTGATAPMTTRAELTMFPFIAITTVAKAIGQSCDSLYRTS